MGDRLHANVSPAVYRAASSLLLCAPETPLLFMGRDPAVRDTIPDPQDEATFCRSVLRWSEIGDEEARSLLRLYRALLAFRRTTPAMQARSRCAVIANAADPCTIALWRFPRGAAPVAVIAQLRDTACDVTVPVPDCLRCCRPWATVLTSEDTAFARATATLPQVQADREAIRVSFHGSAAVVLRGNGTPRHTSDAAPL